MKKTYLFIAMMTVGLSMTAFGQKANDRSEDLAAAANVQIVGIDPTKNLVKLANTTADPLAVKVIGAPARKAFQIRAFVGPTGNGNDTANIVIPAGKRLVIENISAVARIPEGMKVEAALYSYIDSNGDGVGDVQDITFHRIPFIDQGAFGGTQILAANNKVVIFADEQIGASHFGVGLQARLNAMSPAGSFVQIQVTVSGYLEDLPQ